MLDIESIKIIKQYIAENHVFTLCTATSADNLWCANCFYWFDEKHMRLVFLTEEKTQHANMMKENSLVAGGINTQEIIISELQGIQFTGEVSLLLGAEAATARAHYCKRFPVALAALHVPLWQLQLQEIKMVNNRLGFGTKLYWQRDQLGDHSQI